MLHAKGAQQVLESAVWVIVALFSDGFDYYFRDEVQSDTNKIRLGLRMYQRALYRECDFNMQIRQTNFFGASDAPQSLALPAGKRRRRVKH